MGWGSQTRRPPPVPSPRLRFDGRLDSRSFSSFSGSVPSRHPRHCAELGGALGFRQGGVEAEELLHVSDDQSVVNALAYADQE